MSPIVWTAYKISHLKYDMLPPLADYDHLRNLVGKSFPVSLLSISTLSDYVLTCSSASRPHPEQISPTLSIQIDPRVLYVFLHVSLYMQ